MRISQICEFSQEVQTGELLEAVFIDEAINNPESKEADREFVLRATYPTAPLRALVEQIAEKLGGERHKGGVVVRGDVGSGKSHALLALYHLASAGAKAGPWLRRWKVQTGLPRRIQVGLVQLVSEGPRTFWELLFQRTGHPEINEEIQRSPTREQWTALASAGPTLLIIDELELWFGQLTSGTPRKRALAGLQNLMEAANLSDVPLAVVISVYGRDPVLMETVNRTQPPIWDMGAAPDRQKIVLHRLVTKINRTKARQVVRKYVRSYSNVGSELPTIALRLGGLDDEMLETYPFHPDLLKQGFQLYAVAPHYESTRGIIFLCATLLRSRAPKRDLILTGDLDIGDPTIAGDLRKLDPDLVSNALEDLSQRCHSIEWADGILGTILFHSFAPGRAAGATREQVLIGNYRPTVEINKLQRRLDEVYAESWFLDEVEDRLVITKEVQLLKRIEQQARSLIQTPEGRDDSGERLKATLRSFMAPESVYLHPEDPLPDNRVRTGVRYVVSLDPMAEDKAEALLMGRDNTMVLIVPKPSLRGRLTHDDEMVLRAARVLVCESLLEQRAARQQEVRRYKQRFERRLKQQLEDTYGCWMRISRTSELGEEPVYVMRPVECTLSPPAVKAAILRDNDLEVVKSGLQKVLRYYGARASKGAEEAGRLVSQLKDELRRHPGLPLLVQASQLVEALQSMVQDQHPGTGIVVSVGRALYGYDRRPLPVPPSDDWRVWLKIYAPEPPAPQDVKHAVRQALADAGQQGEVVQRIKNNVASRLEVNAAEIVRALAELVNEEEAVLEQHEERFPDDGDVSSSEIADRAHAWLLAYAPPDDRNARERILVLVTAAEAEGIALAELKTHLSLESIGEPEMTRGMERLLLRGELIALVPGPQISTVVRDPSLLTEDTVLRLPIVGPPPPPPPGWEPFVLTVGPYRLLDQFLHDLEARLPDDVRIQSATFRVFPPEEAPDPLFGHDEELAEIAQVTMQHHLRCTFPHPSSRQAFLSISRRVVERLVEVGNLLLTVELSGEVPAHDS